MRRPDRMRRSAPALTIAAAVLLSGVVVATASYSAFSATTANPASNWSAGAVAISDDDAGVAAFTATGLKPGSTGSRCIAITSTGSLPAVVKVYGTAPATTNALSSSIVLSITQGTGGGFGSCTGYTPLATGSAVYSGTLAAFGSAAVSYATGVGSWATTGTAAQSRVYRIDYTLDAAAPNTTQNGTASIGFTWEAQNS